MTAPEQTPRVDTDTAAEPLAGISPEHFPRHIALITDGNGRWAQQRGLPRTEGHRQGERMLFEMVKNCAELGIPYLSSYVFSTENWRRAPAEVRFILGFSHKVLRKRRDELNELGVRIQWAGDRERLWRSVARELDAAAELTAANTRMTLTLCVNYGARTELANAARRIAERVAAGELDPAKVTEETVAEHLYIPDLPDVDLLLRTSGEHRISNYLLWQAAYAEFVFDDIYFPDFDKAALHRAVAEFVGRHRSYGGH